MKTLRITLCALMLAGLLPILAAMPTRAATCTTTLTAGSDIQAAIDAAAGGDVICLAAGTYSPASTIIVNKSVTLQGPQTGVDPRPSAGTTRTPGETSTEAIVDGGRTLATIFRITADGVVLDGLEIRNGTGDMVDSPIGSDIANVALQYNIIRDALGDEGIQLRDCTDCVIEYNHVFDIAQDGINLCCGSTGGLIQFNEVHEDHSENAAVYIYDATLTTIQCNLVYNVTRNEGIKLGTKGGGDAALSGGSIRYNVVHDTAQDGIAVYTSETLVDGNEVYSSNSENGAIYVAHAVANITIADNNVHDNTLNPVKWGDPAGIMIGTAVNATSVTVRNNNIAGNVVNGVTNKAAGLLNAQSNWWGAAGGPGVVGPGSGDKVSTNVDFANWLTERARPEGENPCEEPTAIELASFTAEVSGGTVTLAWETAAEIDNAGFNLYRATTPDGPYTQINGALIVAQGEAASGARYSFLDHGLLPGAYYYRLEDVDTYGVTTLHGPLSAQVAPNLRRPSYRPISPQ